MSVEAELASLSATIDFTAREDFASVQGSLMSSYMGIPNEKIMYPDEKIRVRSGLGTFQTTTESDQLDEQRAEDIGFVTPSPTIKGGKIRVTKREMSYSHWKAEKEKDASNWKNSFIHTENAELTNLFVFGDTLYNAYDGNPIFDTNRNLVKSGIAQTANMTTSALNATTLNLAEVAMMEMKFDDGTPFYRDINNYCLMVGPSNKKTGRELIESDSAPYTTDNQINVYKGRYDLLINPLLVGTYANYAFLIDKTLLAQQKSIIRKYEWELEITPFERDGSSDQTWVKRASYSSQYLPVFYQAFYMFKI